MDVPEPDGGMTSVAIVHDYLTQQGGAERVLLSMVRAFPGAPVYTSVYDRAGTFPEFADVDVRPCGPTAWRGPFGSSAAGFAPATAMSDEVAVIAGG